MCFLGSRVDVPDVAPPRVMVMDDGEVSVNHGRHQREDGEEKGYAGQDKFSSGRAQNGMVDESTAGVLRVTDNAVPDPLVSLKVRCSF